MAVEGDSFARRLLVKSSEGEERALDVDVIFVELGLRPHSELVRGLADLDEQDRVVID